MSDFLSAYGYGHYVTGKFSQQLSWSMQDLLANPFWSALSTEQALIATGDSLARRFPADVIPFAGLASSGEHSIQSLHDLLTPGSSVYIVSEAALPHPGLREIEQIPCVQMMHTAGLHPPSKDGEAARAIQQLGAADVPAMLRLKQLAFPGFSGPRAASLGNFYGIYSGGELIAMAGERLALPGMREVSAVCTHPEHTGKGYATTLVRHVVKTHIGNGLRTLLHASAGNVRAITLYERLGFALTRKLLFRYVQRLDG